MKKFLCMLLAVLMLVPFISTMALAQGEEPFITVDGVKDAAYTDAKSLDYTAWNFYDNNGQSAFEPLDTERVKNTVWFNWDEDSVYLYFQCVSKDDLYKPAEGETEIPDFDAVFYEIAQIYLDTAPTIDYKAQCVFPNETDDPLCNHFCCNAKDGSPGAAYRLMARANPAWDEWNDYYRSDEGMFMTFEEFSELRQGEDGYEELETAYAAANGDKGEAVTFIDYETNTYGFELQYPRKAGEEYFQFNIRTRVNETVWDEYGPELAYTLSFCDAWWLNSEGLIEIWFEDYVNSGSDEGPEVVVDPKVNAIRRQMEALPDELTLENKQAVDALYNDYNLLSDEQKAMLTEEEVAFIQAAVVKIGNLEYIANLGDLNGDETINANDALIALRASVGKIELGQEEIARGDVNGDKKVDAKDALEMLQMAVQKRTQFSVLENFVTPTDI